MFFMNYLLKRCLEIRSAAMDRKGTVKTLTNLFCGENAVLKALFLLLSILFIWEELYTFFILKPTLSKKVKTSLTKDDFPTFMVCPDPGYDLNEMSDLGYNDIWYYKAGLSSTSGYTGLPSVMGWDANQTDSVKNVSSRVSLLKSVEDCPDFATVFWKPQEDDDDAYEFLQFELTRAMFPYHLCCRVLIPKAAGKYPLDGTDISFTNKSYESITLLVSDKVSHTIFEQHSYKTLGDNLISPQKGEGVNLYKLKMHRETNLESDPQSNCLDYTESGEYDRCLEAEIINKMQSFVNCTPPWMTDNENLWCGQEHASEVKNINPDHFLGFMNDIFSGQVDHGKCSVPCRKYSYYSTGLGSMKSNVLTGVTIYFDKIIDDTITEFKVDSVTLLTRFGGILGLTRNLLWLVLLVMTIASYFLSTPSGSLRERNRTPDLQSTGIKPDLNGQFVRNKNIQ